MRGAIDRLLLQQQTRGIITSSWAIEPRPRQGRGIVVRIAAPPICYSAQIGSSATRRKQALVPHRVATLLRATRKATSCITAKRPCLGASPHGCNMLRSRFCGRISREATMQTTISPPSSEWSFYFHMHVIGNVLKDIAQLELMVSVYDCDHPDTLWLAEQLTSLNHELNLLIGD
jgi:hypothetical protein